MSHVKLSTVEFIDEHGRLCAVQFWTYLEAVAYAASVPVLVSLTTS